MKHYQKIIFMKIFSIFLLFIIFIQNSNSIFAQEVSHGETTRIRFESGENSAEIIGSIPSNEQHRYILSVYEGQVIAVKISPLSLEAENNNLFFEIFYLPYLKDERREEIEETQLIPLTDGSYQVWGGVAPFSGEYEILVDLYEGNAMYALEITVLY